MSLDALGELAFRHIWTLLYEDARDPDMVVKLTEDAWGTLLALSPDEQSAFQRAAASFEASSSSLNENQQEFLQIVLGGDLCAAPPD